MLRLNSLFKFVSTSRSISNVSVALGRDLTKLPAVLPEVPVNEKHLTERIRSISDSHELLDMVKTLNKQDLEPHQLSKAMDRLLYLQKTGTNTVQPSQLAQHQGFKQMCQLLKFKASLMEPNDLIISLKVLGYFGFRSEHEIVSGLLHVIKDQINELTLNNLLFLTWMLSKMNRTPLTEALLIAIPIVLDINMSVKLDHNNKTELAELMYYISICSIKVSKKAMTSIITALTLHGTSLELQQARSVVWSLASLRQIETPYEKLLSNCMYVVNKEIMQNTFAEVEMTVSKLNAKVLNGVDNFYNEEFLNNAAKYVVENDVGYLNASFMLKKFSTINFVNYQLLDYLDKTIVSNHSNLSSSKAAGLITLATGFSNANYKSENWEIIKSLVHENPLMQSNRSEIPWIKFALEMMSLDFHSNILLEKVFNKKFIEQQLQREENRTHSQLLLLWQSVMLLIKDYNGPLPEQSFINEAAIANCRKPNEAFLNLLSEIFGGPQFIQTNVSSSHGHCLDFVISFDNNENPVAMPCKIRNFDEIPKSQMKSVAVLLYSRGQFPVNLPEKLRGVFDLKRRTVEALNIPVAHISTHTWANIPESELHDFIEREIRYCLR